MPVPSSITDLSTTAASNSPSGSDSVGSVDDHLRAQASFIAQLRDGEAGAITGTDPGLGGMWPDVTAATTILRARDRLFVNGGSAFTGNRTGTQSGFVPTATEGANWAPRDSLLFCASDKGLMAVTGMVSNANIDTTGGEPTESIGVSGFAIGNKASRSVWGLYSDVQFTTGSYGYGVEIAVKNLGTNQTSTPYFATTGTYGIWLPGGGDNSYGGSSANPNNTAIAIGKNSNTWNRGIVFFADGITGTDGTTGTGVAIEMAKGHRIVWRAPGNIAGFSIRSDVSSASSDMSMTAGNNSVTFSGGSNSKNVLQIVHASSGVNYLGITTAATGGSVNLYAQSDTDTDVNLLLTPLGSGSVLLAGVRSFANDAAAAAASPPVPVGGIYRNGSALQIRVT